MAYIGEILPLMLQGAIISLKLFVLTLVLSLPLGLPWPPKVLKLQA